jgi:hypothetical protein
MVYRTSRIDVKGPARRHDCPLVFGRSLVCSAPSGLLAEQVVTAVYHSRMKPGFPPGDDETSAAIRGFDRASTELGVVEDWDDALSALGALMLGSAQPMFMAWGPRQVMALQSSLCAYPRKEHPSEQFCELATFGHVLGRVMTMLEIVSIALGRAGRLVRWDPDDQPWLAPRQLVEDEREAGHSTRANRHLQTFRQDTSRTARFSRIDLRRENRADQIIQGALALQGSFSDRLRPDQLIGAPESAHPALNGGGKISRGRRSVIFWAQSGS